MGKRIQIIKDTYNSEGLPAAGKETAKQGLGLIKDNPKRAVAFGTLAFLSALTVAYFANQTYKNTVNGAAGSIWAGTLQGGKALYAFIAANPLFAASLAFVILGTISVLVYQNYSQSSAIKAELKTAGQDFQEGNPQSILQSIADIVGFKPQQKTAG